MNKINEIVHYLVELDRFDPDDAKNGVDRNIIERYDYCDMMRVLPRNYLGEYPIESVRMDTRCQIKARFTDSGNEDRTVYVRFVGDGEVHAYCTVEEEWKWLKIIFDDHNWKIEEGEERYIYYDLMNKIKEVYDKVMGMKSEGL